MKTISRIIAVTLAASSILTLAGCAATTATAKVTTLANWNIRNTDGIEGDYSSFWQLNAEKAVYNITPVAGSNSAFSVTYEAGGRYETKFYMQAAYDWNGENIPEELRSTDFKAEPVYVYETTLTLSGNYTLKKSGESVPFEDSIKTTVKFRLAENNLQPVYSYQDVCSTSALTRSPATKEEMCATVDAVYETYYSHDCTKAVTTVTEEGKEPSSSTRTITGRKDYSLFDTYQLQVAVRALTKSDSRAYSFDVHSPIAGNTQSVTATCGSTLSLDPEQTDQKDIISALNASYPYLFVESGKDEEGNERTYRYSPVSLSIDASMAGQSSTLWYAAVENSEINAARAVLIKVVTPLPFNLGTLHYNLSSIGTEKIG